MKDDRDWIPDATDLDWIESNSVPPPAAVLAIEAAAEPLGVPIVDRHSGRVLSVLAGDRRRIVEVGTAYGYSTLWMALGQPADGTIVTIDPDRERTDLARGWWREAGIADDRITVVTAKALEAFAGARIRPSRGRSTWPSSTPSSPSTRRTWTRSSTGPPGAGRARRRRQRPVERPRLRVAPGGARRREHGRPPRGSASGSSATTGSRATILPVGDGLLIATWRG